MEIHYTMTEGTMVVSLMGRLDANTAPDFVKCCAGWTVMPMILDLTSLEYLSSIGLRALLQLKRDFAKQGADVVLAGCGGAVDKVIRVSGFEQVFMLYPSVPVAMRAVAGGGA
jgi:anti-sigma B factor antagonist